MRDATQFGYLHRPPALSVKHAVSLLASYWECGMEASKASFIIHTG